MSNSAVDTSLMHFQVIFKSSALDESPGFGARCALRTSNSFFGECFNEK